jgi:hypothetical protein
MDKALPASVIRMAHPVAWVCTQIPAMAAKRDCPHKKTGRSCVCTYRVFLVVSDEKA